MIKKSSGNRKQNRFDNMTTGRLKAFELFVKAQKKSENDSLKSHGRREIDSNDEDNGKSVAQPSSVSFNTISQQKMKVSMKLLKRVKKSTITHPQTSLSKEREKHLRLS